MFSRLPAKAGLFVMVNALGALLGCGSPPSIVGSWNSTTNFSASLQTDWSFTFTADDKLTLKFVTTSSATSGQGAGCVNTVSVSGTYTAVEPNLTVTAQSGTTIYERCLNSAENTSSIALNAANLAMFAKDFTGPFSVTADELTLPKPESGIGPGVLNRK